MRPRPIPFPEGALAGAATPRELAGLARLAPEEAAANFASGAVARWYRANGWDYPLPASGDGVALLRQFFESLGLARLAPPPPPIDWLPVPAEPPRPLIELPRPAPTRRAPVVALTLLALVLVLIVGLAAALWPSRGNEPAPGEETAAIPPATVRQPPELPQPREPAPSPPRAANILPRDPLPQGRPILLPQMEHRYAEVVFCLDTTGSMGGLLSAARRKTWSVCNQVAGGRPSPSLRVGLVAYKDRGDEYVTRVTDLTRDLDAVYAELAALTAGGGGDRPESVNQALYDAVHKVKWSTDKRTLRIIFLVGDAPPHMDYTDDVKYPETCKKAVEKGLIINTIQCGDDADCRRAWKDIAAKGNGEYVAIPQDGGAVTVVTKFDAPLAELGKGLFATALIYGGVADKKRGERMLAGARQLSGPPAADRVAYAARSGRIGPYDLLDDLQARRVRLDHVLEAELPDALRKLRPAARQAHLDQVAARRKALYAEALGLEKQRAAVIAAERRKRGSDKDSFDESVLRLLRQQAKRFEIEY